MSYLNEFFLLKHLKDGIEIMADILPKDYISTVSTKNGVVCLKESDPVLFSAKYFALLDAGFCPVLIPAETPDYQFKNVVNFCEGIKKSDVFAHSYGCLTSGTTGIPKISFHSVNGARILASSHARSLNITQQNILLQALPLTHAFGVVCYLWTALEQKVPLHFLTIQLTPQNWNQLVSKKTVVHLSPAMGRLIIKSSCKELLNPEAVSVGAGVFYRSEFLQLKNLFYESKIYVTYGFTEAGPRVSTGEILDDLPIGSIGKALDVIQVGVLQGNKIQKAGRGLLCVKTPAAKLNVLEAEVINGYLVSQDEVEIDKNGYIQYIDRIDDLIKVGGVSVYPSNILNLFKKIFPVQEAVILKEGHPIYGEIPVLFVEGPNQQEVIKEQLFPHLSAIQRPKKIMCIEKFPRDSFGKIDRKYLKELMV
ncbi:MAG: acyl--CoA ligase [Oligoflexia bacterium]|nr:acyl--CoA ligase [Oligoflexia bacterium]